ncbi:uncharacterized protein LOC119771856 isoform X2 [Cyprinodon tularosa]|uniref:uncharacterized protein LOC119771856 isoform X2 n=1 Tax=Cyprinodon tularosa TaxID=77115 RepID=UPI0018E2782F|nr:uncharacterized protein LOC119771856 isoform X2 [Cyprinodon tularosa]
MLENKTTNLVDDITLLEIKVSAQIGNAAKSKQESSDALDKLLREASAMNNNEFKESEDELRRHMSYADQLFKLAPTAPEEVADSKCVGTALKSGPDGTLPLECAFPILLSEKLSTDLFHISYCSSEKIYLSDPLEVVDLYKVQRQRILILHQHIEARVQKLKDIKQDVKEMKEKVSHLEENLSIQESDIKPMLEMEDRRANKFRRRVQLKETQKTETQDPIFTTVDRRVTEIYSCFFKEQPISTPTREKLISVIEPILALMKTLENIPEKELQQERDALIKARFVFKSFG